LHAPVRQAPPQLPAAQHTPCTQVSPVLHPLLAAHACPGPPAGGSCVWQWPAPQVCPAGHARLPAAQDPALQILVATVVPSAHALPQSVPSARGSHAEPSARHFPVTQAPLQASAVQHRPPTHPSPLVQAPVLSPHSSPGPRATASHSPLLELQVVPGSHLTGEHFQPEAASHSLHLPEQAWSQQCPATQAPDLHASLPVHAPPRSWGTAAHRPSWQLVPEPQVVAWGWHSPCALQVKVCNVPAAVHEGAPQLAPAAAGWQPPFPSQPFWHPSSLQVPLGSEPLAGTGVQVPGEPARPHD
jgi:hypothetical protein